MANLPRIEVPHVEYGSQEAAMLRYRADGERRTMALGSFMAQLYGCNAANGSWVVPGSHPGKADIKDYNLLDLGI